MGPWLGSSAITCPGAGSWITGCLPARAAGLAALLDAEGERLHRRHVAGGVRKLLRPLVQPAAGLDGEDALTVRAERCLEPPGEHHGSRVDDVVRQGRGTALDVEARGDETKRLITATEHAGNLAGAVVRAMHDGGARPEALDGLRLLHQVTKGHCRAAGPLRRQRTHSHALDRPLHRADGGGRDTARRLRMDRGHLAGV
jgi:hypothetical protein